MLFNNQGWSSITSGSIGFNTPGGTYSYGLTRFGGNYSQTVGKAGFSVGRFSISTENDFLSGSGDKFRSAALSASYQVNDDVAITGGFKLFTSAPTGEVSGGYEINGKNRRVHTENSPVLRNGIAYGGVNYKGRSYQFGYNSESIRARIQNGWHNIMPYVFMYKDKTNVPHFKRMSYGSGYYFNYGIYNSFTAY